jgi:hypothetical protein
LSSLALYLLTFVQILPLSFPSCSSSSLPPQASDLYSGAARFDYHEWDFPWFPSVSLNKLHNINLKLYNSLSSSSHSVLYSLIYWQRH